MASLNLGVDVIGVEAHKFVAGIARVKCFRYERHHAELDKEYESLVQKISSTRMPDISGKFPDLIYRCFEHKNLSKLLRIRNTIQGMSGFKKRFFELALISALRHSSSAGTGWPYIAPSKYAAKNAEDADAAFKARCKIMLDDISHLDRPKSHTLIKTGDSRNLGKFVSSGSANLIITSPPYLNNYDYADRTRMETYFLGLYKDWADISRNVRDKLMMAATTQINKNSMKDRTGMPTVRELSARIHDDLSVSINKMSIKKTEKPGKKNYDLMTMGYFEDISRVMIGAAEATTNGGHFVLVLGDSAPYGIYVPTDRIIGQLAVAAGFREFDIQMIRRRGDKWRNNPQRHGVKLRESIVSVTK